MSDERFEYAKKLTEFIAEAQEYVDCEGLELIDRYNKSLPVLLEKAEEVLSYTPDEEKAEVAWKLYQVLIQKNDEAMEAAMSQPFFTAAECVHYVMLCWMTILKGLPELAPNRVRSEIIRCEEMCKESQKGHLPKQRLIYKAYMTSNKRVSYGKWFRDELKERWQ